MKWLNKNTLRTKAGIFVFEVSPWGLYSVLFPKVRRPGFTRRDYERLSRALQRRKLDLTGFTRFQRKVYAALRKVPSGKTVTYSELARRAGFPGAARAVGSAMRMNRLPIVIPCHRVILSSGGLGEYSLGKKWKKKLLEHEAPGGAEPQRSCRVTL